MFTAVLDSCVLWPSLLRDFLLSLAIEGAYRAVWGSAILAEVERNEARKLRSRGYPEVIAAESARILIANMRSGFADSEVFGWEQLAGGFGLPDADDEHVLAVATVSRSDAIVTANLRDFPRALIPLPIRVLAPSAFVLDIVERFPGHADEAVRQIAQRSGTNGRPRRTDVELMDTLAHRYGLGRSMALLRSRR